MQLSSHPYLVDCSEVACALLVQYLVTLVFPEEHFNLAPIETGFVQHKSTQSSKGRTPVARNLGYPGMCRSYDFGSTLPENVWSGAGTNG